MSHASSSLAHRPLSTTEELERLEQSITLTLQEIDRNFSKAHRIVTTNILPVVEQYGEQCRAVWDASKFWKQFFEAAANVSLSGYEELAAQDESTTAAEETTATHDDEDTSTDYNYTPRGGDANETVTPRRPDESLLSDGDSDLSGSTPRQPATKSATKPLRPQFAAMRSPYETLRQELNRKAMRPGAGDSDEDESSILESRSRVGGVQAPGGLSGPSGDHADDSDDSSAADSALLAERTARLPDMSMTPRLSLDERHRRAAEEQHATAQRQKDPLLHRVLDKTYRIQATPHKTATRGISPMRLRVAEHLPPPPPLETRRAATAWQDSSPMSSPEMAVPKLRSAAFLSPVRAAYRSKLTAAAAGPRTPGVSVQTPATQRTRNATLDEMDVPEDSPSRAAGSRAGKVPSVPDEITWESSDEDGEDLYGGMSPPKTINFALPPSKLLQTPAREASKRIVEDILYTAGDDTGTASEYSPTMVKMNANILDDTF